MESHAALAFLSKGYSPLEGMSLTYYSPVRRFTRDPKVSFSLGLHVLGVPPAFVLSQDQTLQLGVAHPKGERLQIHPLEFPRGRTLNRCRPSRLCEAAPTPCTPGSSSRQPAGSGLPTQKAADWTRCPQSDPSSHPLPACSCLQLEGGCGVLSGFL